MANTDKSSPPIASNTTAPDSLTVQSVFNWWDTPQPKNNSYYNRIKTYFFLAPKFSPRHSVIRTAHGPVPSWKTSVRAFLAHQSIAQSIRVTLIRARLITMSPNDGTLAGGDAVVSTNNTSNIVTGNSLNATVATVNRVNWIHHVRFPRELRDEIYSYLLPFNILIRGGAFDASEINDFLRIDSRSSNEFRQLMQNEYHHIFEFTSITTMLTAFDTAPPLTLAHYKKLTIRVTGPYNGHSNIYGNNNGWHRTNICPTIHRDGDDVWFEIGYTCLDCKDELFAQRELNFAIATLLPKIERLTGPQCPRPIYVRIFAWTNGFMIPHVRAYRLTVSIWSFNGIISGAVDRKANIVQEIWQPWKPVLPNMFGTTFNQDCLDFLYVDGGDDENDLADGLWYAAPGAPQGLGDRIEGDMTYLIL